MQKINDSFIMRPIVDICFKELMRNPAVRAGFAAAIMNCRPEEVEETYLMPTHLQKGKEEEEKQGILDVRVLLKQGTQIGIEMQVNYFEYWDERILFYLCKMFTEQLMKGDPYGKLQRCIHVSILDFIHFPEDQECYRKIHFRDGRTGKLFSDKLEIQMLELRKLPEGMAGGDGIFAWMKFLSGKSREEFENMAKTNEYLKEACDTLIKLSADDEKRLEYEARERALRDYNTQIQSAMELGEARGLKKGMSKGINKGISKGKKMVLRNLFLRGISAEDGAAIVEMDISAVREMFRQWR